MKRTLLKLLIILPIICIALPLDSFAQSQSSTQAARKFDEFGDILLTDIKARLDGFAIQLQSEPGTRGFIIIYRTRHDLPGLNSKLAARMKNYLVNDRGIDVERIVTVDGGVASSLAQELWIVPVGATPKPRDDVYTGQLIDTTSAWKFDEYYYPSPHDDGEYGFDADSLEAFVDALQREPHSQAYILAYSQYYRRGGYLDPPNTALKMLKAVRANLVNKYRVSPSRIKVVNGGYRKQRQIELWIVPRGEHPPVATPNAFPKKRR
jgi:hypothetical protein